MATPNLVNPISITPGILVSTKITVTTDSPVYTVGINRAAQISQGTITNTSGAPCTVGLSIIPAGGSADGSHKVIPDTYSLGAGDTLPLKDYIGDARLGDGDAIYVHAGTANALDVVITGSVIA